MADTLTRYRVTMRSVQLNDDGVLLTYEAEDFVDTAHLEAYVADAKTRWQAVIVSDTPDDGPGGATGAYDAVAATTAPIVEE